MAKARKSSKESAKGTSVTQTQTVVVLGVAAKEGHEELTPGQYMRKTLQESFSHLPKETIDDLTELLQMVPGATEEHHREIVATIVEILVPESLCVKMVQEYSLEHEDPAVRDRVNEYRAKVGLEIRRVRCEKQMTQEALAEAAGLPQPHICKLEKGVHVPTHLTLEKIAKALGVPSSQIDPGCDS